MAPVFMAAQLRSVAPSSSPFPRLHPPGSSTFRIEGIAHNKGACFFSFSAPGSAGKQSSAFSASAFSSPSPSSPSTVATGSYVAPESSENGGNGDGSFNGNSGGGNGGGGDDYDKNGHGHGHGDPVGKGGLLGAFLKGWNERVSADPQFPFKVLMEEVVGVSACVIGDMASRPNFGLNELDFVFSTIVVGSILNFSLMYMLAPTSAAASVASMLPSIFSSCPPGHMFEQGAYSLLDRLGTFVYKGAVFATVGFAAGLFGTVISNLLIGMRKKMDPNFESQNNAPPTVLNAATWAIHMGLSSNLRYQVVNGFEFAMANVLPPSAFKASIFCTRALNNVLGGMSFVALARLTGSQKAEEAKVPTIDAKESETSTIEAEQPKVFTSELTPTDKVATREVDSTKEVGSNLLKEDDAAQ